MKKPITFIVALIAIGVLAYFFWFNKVPADTASDQEVTSSAKIDINAVCEGALAYMSFPSSVEADKYVAECKNGEHPEVIEKYKQDMNVGDGANI